MTETSNLATQQQAPPPGWDVPLRPLGLIGGMSWRSSALYYSRLNAEIERRHGPHRNAIGMLLTLDFARLLHFADAGHWEQMIEAIVSAGRKLEAAGCRVVALTAVTGHIWHPPLRDALGARVPHVLERAAERLDALHVERVGLLGTGRTCASDFAEPYLNAGGRRTVLRLPAEAQRRIDGLISTRLTVGAVESADRAVLIEAIDALATLGAQAVVLACTELPLLLPLPRMQDPPIILDAVALHVEALCDLMRIDPTTTQSP